MDRRELNGYDQNMRAQVGLEFHEPKRDQSEKAFIYLQASEINVTNGYRFIILKSMARKTR